MFKSIFIFILPAFLAFSQAPDSDKLHIGDRVLYGNTIRVIEALDNRGRVVLKATPDFYQQFASTSQISLIEASPFSTSSIEESCESLLLEKNEEGF